MKFDDIVKQILEDYNYSYNSGNTKQEQYKQVVKKVY